MDLRGHGARPPDHHPRKVAVLLAAAGGQSWGLPAAIALRLGCPERPVVALIGDGARPACGPRRVTRCPLRSWTNTKYRTLQEFSEILHVPEGDCLDISGLGVLDIARGYGLEVHRAESLEGLTDHVRKGMTATGPRFVEILER
ncbi:thiamine pyrophosphate-dependent enzyme [Streptomyces sp. NPDC093064]|uniref:thiamine pyrophosphate-dependent enzyme n=1 Tax=Streptomyces sp. NPDC093064 TaxID=3366020 RepID=UPI0037FC64AA